MTNLVYRGSPPVGPVETQALLASEFAAIWSPPMYRQAAAKEGDRLWLVWQEGAEEPQLLGRGIVIQASEDNAFWTNASARGITEAARSRGYRGPTNMAFLRLREVQVVPDHPAVRGLGNVPVGLNVATREQVAALETIWGANTIATPGESDARAL